MSTGFVLFRLADRTFATSLDDVREIVRLEGLERLPGAQSPLAGLIVLRGAPLPVFDLREAANLPGDVLVLDRDDDPLGVAVDGVLAVLNPADLPDAGDAPRSLPAYVVGVRRHNDVPVLLVDLRLLLDRAAAAGELCTAERTAQAPGARITVHSSAAGQT
jgi:chemotaxis signal transduction protein